MVDHKLDLNSIIYESPIGYLKLISSGEELIEIKFMDYKEEDKIDLKDPILHLTIKELDEYFHGERKYFTVPFKYTGTYFQTKVWKELINIPYGETKTYKDISERIGKKNAARAVGNANNKNKLPIIIPCHRVIGSNKKLVGYAGELWRKQKLLQLEGAIY